MAGRQKGDRYDRKMAIEVLRNRRTSLSESDEIFILSRGLLEKSSRVARIAPTVASIGHIDSLFEVDVDSQRWEYYLRRLSDAPVNLSKSHAAAVRSVWEKISIKAGVLIRPPVAGPGGEAGFQLAWKTDLFYLDIDIAPDAKFGWYFMNRIDSTDAGSDENDLSEPPEELIRLLVRYCRLK